MTCIKERIGMKMKYTIVSTGSKGNAVIIESSVLIDAGVSYKTLEMFTGELKTVLLTHIHSDHFNESTVHRIAKEKPLLRFVCGKWMVEPLLKAGVKTLNIDVVKPLKFYRIGNGFEISPIKLYHDVPNIGYRIYRENEKLLYATDTGHLKGISAKDYDVYLIEANYEDTEIKQRIQEKVNKGEYAYEMNVIKRHLSKQQADEFIFNNAGLKSRVEYLHQHEGLNF